MMAWHGRSKRVFASTTTRLLPLIIGLAVCVSPARSAPIVPPGVVDSVILYPDYALVNRKIDIDKSTHKGLYTVLVGNLPEQIVPAAVFAEDGPNVLVRSLSYDTRTVTPTPPKVVDDPKATKELQDSNERLKEIQEQLQELTVHLKSLDKLEQRILAPATNPHGDREVLIPQPLEQLADYLASQRDRLVEREAKLNHQLNLITNEQAKLKKAAVPTATKPATTVREAAIDVSLPDDKGGTFWLRYLVKQASWKPAYRVTFTSAGPALTLQRLALVNQTSGEDWLNADLTISTGAPLVLSASPQLQPLDLKSKVVFPPNAALPAILGQPPLRFNDPGVVNTFQKALTTAIDSRTLAGSPAVAGKVSGTTTPYPGQLLGAIQAPDVKTLNAASVNAANSLQLLELGGGATKPAGVWFAVQEIRIGAVNLRNGANAQVVPLGRDEVLQQGPPPASAVPAPGTPAATLPAPTPPAPAPGFFTVQYRATPLLSPYVYRESVLTLASTLPPGNVAAFVDGRFVGEDTIASFVPAGQSFPIGLGIDPLLHTTRTPEPPVKTGPDANGKIYWQYTYKLAIESAYPAGASIRDVILEDRIPTVTQPPSAVINGLTVIELDPVKLAPLPHPRPSPGGIVTWTGIAVPGQSLGKHAVARAYQFLLEGKAE